MGSAYAQNTQSNVTALFNTFYNFPQIYNHLLSVALFVFKTPFSEGITAAQAGNHLGLAVAQVLMNPQPYQ